MKKIYNLKLHLLLVLNLLTASYLLSQQTTINFVSSSAILANPERGWYDDYYSHTGGSSLSTYYHPLSKRELTDNREKDKITLILRMFYLHEFLDQSNVSEEYLSKMQADFDSVREAGVKCIIRFAYSASQSAAVWDATPEKVFSHIESLRPVLEANTDIIAGVQAGFIGAWGEWYYTRNFAGNGYIPSAGDQENRRILVENLLGIFPDNISVDARTPAIMRNIVQSDAPVTEEEAFNGSIKSRVGHHNDCFLADRSDYGTYVNLTEDLAYLHETTKYTITGGETCDASNNYSNCENGVPRMKELHWTYLNRDYNRDVYDKWKEQGCYDEINLSLGYRIRLISATMDDSVTQGSSLGISLVLSNDGYAAPTQYKPIQFILTNTVTGAQTTLYYAGTNGDIRHWLPGEIHLEGQVTMPDTISDGNYKIFLRLPDQDSVLALNPAYSIQMANVGTWDENLGVNILNHIISVGSGGVGSIPKTPAGIHADAVSETQIELTWTDMSDNEEGFELMRSEKEENIWIKIAELDSNTLTFSDDNLYKGTTYHYMIRATNKFGNSDWSESASATTLGINALNTPSEFMAIYPNPLKNDNLSIQFGDNSEKQIIVTKLSGEVVYKTSIRETFFQLDRALFNPGIYLISMTVDNRIFNKKIIVL
jgi:hypothetical protein